MEAVVLHRVGFLEYFCPKQGQDFKPLAAPLYPNMGQVPHCEYESSNKHVSIIKWTARILIGYVKNLCFIRV